MKKAFSLVELLVAIGIVAVLVGLSIPAINALQKSYDSTGADSMISAALNTARTLAISNHQYAGVRFQKIGDPNNSLKADQYMIFVINDVDISNVEPLFRAIEGYKPIKLPSNIGVIDMMVRINHNNDDVDPQCQNAKERPLQQSDLNNFDRSLTDISAFSIVFSSAGKLVINDIRTRSKEGRWRPPDLVVTGSNPKGSTDTVFNSFINIMNNHTGQFVQDDYAQSGLGGEKSRREFYIYDRDKFNKLTTAALRWDYLSKLKVVFVNPYSGQLIEK